MVSSFCGSVLLLLLITCGQHVMANKYGSRRITPYSEQSELLPRGYKPAASSYESYPPPRTSVDNFRLAERASPRSYSPLSATSSQSGSYGRSVDGHSQPRSVSSYRPGPVWPPKSREVPQQPPKNVQVSKTSMWVDPSPRSGRNFGSRVVSSGAIEILPGPKTLVEKQPGSETQLHQRPRSPATATLQVGANVRDGRLGSSVRSTKLNQQADARPRSPRPVTSSSSVLQPRSGTSGVLQSNKGMWATGLQLSDNVKAPYTSTHMHSTGKPVKQSSLQVPSNVNPPPPASQSYTRYSLPSSDHLEVFQTKKGMWDSSQPGNALYPASRIGLAPTPRPPRGQQPPYPYGRTDIKTVVWDGDDLSLRPRSKPVPLASVSSRSQHSV